MDAFCICRVKESLCHKVKKVKSKAVPQHTIEALGGEEI
jgi:hypothetical protein